MNTPMPRGIPKGYLNSADSTLAGGAAKVPTDGMVSSRLQRPYFPSATVLTPSTTLVQVAPYAAATAGTPDIGTGTAGTRDIFNFSQQYRIRQTGTAAKVKFYWDTKTNVSAVYVTIWRKNGATYDLVGKSEDLLASITATSLNTLTLSSPITGAQVGDYVGLRVTSTGSSPVMKSLSGIANAKMYYVDATPSDTGYAWESQNFLSGYEVPIEIYMTAPLVTFIGDSIMAGHPANYSFLETTATTSLSTTIPYYVSTDLNATYQNMGIGSQTTSNIVARFTTDVVNQLPIFAILQGGVNDIAGGVITQATFIANWTTMLDACVNNGIVPVVILIAPWTNGTNTQMQTRDTWNAALTSLCAASYPQAIVINLDSDVGQFRAGGDAGNLWDIKTAYDADGVHFNTAGYTAVSTSITNQFFWVSGSKGGGKRPYFIDR